MKYKKIFIYIGLIILFITTLGLFVQKLNPGFLGGMFATESDDLMHHNNSYICADNSLANDLAECGTNRYYLNEDTQELIVGVSMMCPVRMTHTLETKSKKDLIVHINHHQVSAQCVPDKPVFSLIRVKLETIPGNITVVDAKGGEFVKGKGIYPEN